MSEVKGDLGNRTGRIGMVKLRKTKKSGEEYYNKNKRNKSVF